jgi:hypothetical protein
MTPSPDGKVVVGLDWNDPEVKALGQLRDRLVRLRDQSSMPADWHAGVTAAIEEVAELIVELSGSFGAEFARSTRGIPE